MATTSGTSDSDILIGGSGSDTIDGGAGSDFINSGSGSDTVDGGTGSDTINAGSGNDTLIYDFADALNGSKDVYIGGSGIDTLKFVLSQSQYDEYLTQFTAFKDLVTQYLNRSGELSNSNATNFVFTLPNGCTLTVSMIEKLEFDISSSNHAPVIAFAAGQDAGTVVEAGDLDDGADVLGTPSVGGLLTASDPDAGATQTWSIVGSGAGTYGTFSLSGNSGQWTYVLDNTSADALGLAEGVSHTETYVVQVMDDKGAQDQQTVTITITGTNDAPVIAFAAGQDAGTVVEAGDLDDGADVLGTPSVGGLLTASDPDAGATQTWSIVGSGAGTYGTFSLSGNSGQWTYVLDNTSADTLGLAEGVSHTETYVVQVMDDKGAQDQQTVTITITGTNDAPVIAFAAGQDAGTVVEAGDLDDGADVLGTPSVGGLLTASDPDTGATQTWSIVGSGAGTYGTFSLSGNSGQWTYVLDNTSADALGLAEGVSHTETYVVQVMDDKGAQDQQTVTITITGTNDAPVIKQADVAFDVSEALVETNAALATSGRVVFSDVDAGDTPSASLQASAVTASGITLTATQMNAITSGFSISDAATGAWSYNLASPDFLPANSTVTAMFTVRVTDDSGAYVDQDVEITIDGTNDAPVALGETIIVSGGLIQIDPAWLLGNDSDAEGAVTLASLPAGFSMVGGKVQIDTSALGAGTAVSIGGQQYTLYNALTYQVQDASLVTSSATLNLAVVATTNGAETITFNSSTLASSFFGASGSTAGSYDYAYVDGRNGADTIQVVSLTGGGDFFIGGVGADTLTGGAGNDILQGDNGADALSGGTGNDTLTGGTGVDVFLFDSQPGSTNVDTITDFDSAGADADMIHLSQAVFTGLGVGSLTGTNFSSVSVLGGTYSGACVIYETSTGALYYDSTGGMTDDAIYFASLQSGTGADLSDVGAGDFRVV